MDPYSSGSGDAFDSMGFNEFMNAQGSSDEEKTSAARLPGRRNAGVFENAKHGDMYSGGAVSRNPYAAYGSGAADPYAFGGGGGLGGDPYSFNFDFSSVKAPPKKLPDPPKNEPSKSALRSSKDASSKKEVSFENPDSLTSILTSAKPLPSKLTAPPSSQPTAQSKFAALAKAYKEDIHVMEEEEEAESSEKDEAFIGSEESFEDVGPSLKVVNWSDLRKEKLKPDERKEIDDLKESIEKPPEQPISLVRKFTEERKVPAALSSSGEAEEDLDISESNPSPGPIIKSEPFRIPGPRPLTDLLANKGDFQPAPKVELPSKPAAQQEAPIRVDITSAYAKLEPPSKPDPSTEPIKTWSNRPIIESLPVPSTLPQTASKPGTDLSPGPSLIQRNEESERPALLSFSPVASSVVPAAPKAILSLSRESSSFILGKLPQPRAIDSSYQLAEYQARLGQLQEELEAKQVRIYELEKERMQSAFAKLEGDALEKTKLALREANHKLELYHIEIEELVKQVDLSEARVKDLEVENAGLHKTLEAKNKQLEERPHTVEARAEERLLRESNRLLSLEKEQFSQQLQTLSTDLAYYKDLSSRLEKETAELRARLTRFHDQSAEVNELKGQVYLLTVQMDQKGKETGENATGREEVKWDFTMEDLEKPENRVKIAREYRMLEGLVRGYQRENEKLVDEMKSLKEHLAAEHRRMYVENKKLESLRAVLIKEQGGMLIKEGISDLSAISDLAGGTVVSRGDIEQMRERLARAEGDIREREKLAREREAEMAAELERLRRWKMESESYMAGAAPKEVYSDVSETIQEYESKISSILQAHKQETSALESKLKWYLENQEFLTQKDTELKHREAEVAELREKLSSSKPSAKEAARIRDLERSNKLLETQLKEKDPNSVAALIRAAKPSPEESALVQSLQERIETLSREVADKETEYEGKIRALRQEFESYRAKSDGKAKKAGGKVRDSVAELRIKELEKQVDDTKAYYLKRIKEGKGGAGRPEYTSEASALLAQKDRLIEALQTQLASNHSSSPTPGLLYSFLSSATGLLWCQVIHSLAGLGSAAQRQDARAMAEELDRLLEVLDAGTNGKVMQQFQAVGQIADRCMDISGIITASPIDWTHLQAIYSGLTQRVDEELWKQIAPLRGSMAAGHPEAEETLFRDEDYEAEETQERWAIMAYEQMQGVAARLTNVPAPPTPLPSSLSYFQSKLPSLPELHLRAFLRLVLSPDFSLNLPEVTSFLRSKGSSWWKQTLKDSAFHLKTQSNLSTVPIKPDLAKWLSDGAVLKLREYGDNKGVDETIEGVFEGLGTVSMTGLRRKMVEMRVGITREELRALFTVMDGDRDGLVSRTDLIQVMRPKPKIAWSEKAEPSAPLPSPSKPDLSPQLQAAQARIKELEAALKQKDRQPSNTSPEALSASRVANLEEDFSRLQTKYERIREENERLKLEKGRLETHIERTPAAPGTADFVSLQRKIEMLEDGHYRREQTIRTQLDTLSLSKDQEMQQLRRKHEAEVVALQRLLTIKSQEIEGFKGELEMILSEMARVQQRR